MSTYLRDYQKKLLEDVQNAWNLGARCVIMQLCTGGGKTRTFTELIAIERLKKNSEILLVAHRHELITQLSVTLASRGVVHDILAADVTLRECVSLQLRGPGAHYNRKSNVTVASILTAKRYKRTPTLIVIDEGHHVLKANVWGKLVSRFPDARVLLATATPVRADGSGLGLTHDGFAEAILCGPSMRELIERGYISDFRIFCPPGTGLELSSVPVSSTGDYSPAKLSLAVHKSKITGDVVAHYLKHAEGKRGLTFCVDVEAARAICKVFNDSEVPAQVVTAKTPLFERIEAMRRLREGILLQLVSVDILGEGVDVPAVEVISLARPTKSFAIYSQQVGRGLRVSEGKEYTLILDHVNNVKEHMPPDFPRIWSLAGRSRNEKSIVKIQTCLRCYFVYERVSIVCPHCGFKKIPAPLSRRTIESVEGDLVEFKLEIRAALEAEIKRIDAPVRLPRKLSTGVHIAIEKKHMARQEAQTLLRASIDAFLELFKTQGESYGYRKFFIEFGIDALTAKTLSAKKAKELKIIIDAQVINRYDELSK